MVYAEQMTCEIAGLFLTDRKLSLSKWGKAETCFTASAVHSDNPDVN